MAVRTNENWVSECEKMAAGIRLRVYEHVIKNRGGYLSQACSSACTFRREGGSAIDRTGKTQEAYFA